MTIHDLKHLHPGDIKLWLAVEEATYRFAEAQKVKIRCVVPTSLHEVGTQAGSWCERTKVMEISLRRTYDAKKKKWGSLYQVHYLIDTIAHEMAHAKLGRKERPEHGPLFSTTHGQMLIAQEKMKLRLDLLRTGAKFSE